MSAKAFTPHDHNHCVADGMRAAEDACTAAGKRLTPVRAHVLEVLLREHRAMGAYEILDELRQAGFSAQPPQAYRALEFLTDAGLAHRIERLNAFVACSHPGAQHAPAFMICRECGSVAEAEVDNPLGGSAVAAGFQVERAVVEAEGLCPECQEPAS